MTEKNKTTLISAALVAITLFLGTMFFDWTLVPHLQMAHYIAAAKAEGTDPSLFVNDAYIFSPDSSAQEAIREDAMTRLLNEHDRGILVSPSPVLDKALQEMQAYADRHPEAYEDLVFVGKGYDTEASLKNDPALLKTAETYYEKAQALMPNRQEGVYLLAINLLTQGDDADGLGLLEGAVTLDPEIALNHYELAEASVVAGKQYYDQSLANFEIALYAGLDRDESLTRKAYAIFLPYYYNAGDTQKVLVVASRLETLDPAQKDIYAQIVGYIQAKGVMPVLTLKNSGQ